jgi:adhesin/invasin
VKISRIFRHAAIVSVPFAALAIHACSEVPTLDSVLVRPTEMFAVGATSITATAGAVVPNPVTVLVKDQGGEPLPNQSVTFTFSRGTPASATAVTNDQGQATPATWTAPTLAGPATITATVPGFQVPEVDFAVTVNAGSPSAMAVAPTSTNPQNGVAGAAVTSVPAVRVTDAFGNGVQGVTVAFTIQSGGGTLNGSSATTANAVTGTNGIASLTSWILGTTAGANTVRAAAAVLPAATAITFTATGAAGAVNKIVIAPPGTSQNQTAQGGTNVPNGPSVLVTDVNNNPVANVVARFTIATGGGKVLANSGDATGANTLDATTNASGIATVFGWKLGVIAIGPSPATQTLSVTIPSASSVPAFTISASATSGAPATIVVRTEVPSSQNQTAVVGTDVTAPPVAVVMDAQSNIVPNTSVTFTVGANSGTFKTSASSGDLTSGSMNTDANGVVRLFSWKLGNRGANTLTAAVTSNTAINVVFSATGTAGPPASIAIENVNQQNQTTVANTAVANAPAVVVRDANNLTVEAGTDITFRITAGGGAVSATGCTGTATSVSVTTDANGVARLGCWKPGTVGAGNTLRAEVTATPAIFVLFNATGTVGPPTQIAFTNGPWPFTRATTNNGGVPKVTVKDAAGNGVSGLTVNWTNGANANSTVGGTTSSTTDASGVAQFGGAQGGTWTAANVASGSGMTLQAAVAATALTASTTSTVVTSPSSISALISPSATTTVNTNVTPTPVVVVLDASGRPVPGTALTWGYTANPGSNGAIVGFSAATDSVGRATPGVWRVSQTAGTNTVQATVNATAITISLTTTGVAGTASQIAVNGGNTQTAPTSTAVTTPPSVLVRDQFNNVVAGVSVTFSPTTGSGSVTGSPATTNASGIATVGSWTLGSTAGTHTLNAFLTATPAVTTSFTATATASDPCLTSVPYTIGTVANGTLAAGDCTVNNRFGDIYSFTTSAATTQIALAENSFGNFEPTLWSNIWPSNGSWGWRSGTVTDSVWTYLVLAPGSYTFRASSEALSATGAYRISSQLNPTQPTGCGYFLVTKGITVTHSIDSCNYTTGSQTNPTTANSKAYILFLPAGQTATVRMNEGTLSDPYLECWLVSSPATFASPQFIPGCFDDDSGGGTNGRNSLMTIASAGSDRHILIRATHFSTVTPATGNYTFIIDP